MKQKIGMALCAACLLLSNPSAIAWGVAGLESVQWQAKHGAQGTGNYKGKRDRHEKPTPMHEKKRKSPSWVPQKQ